MAKINNILLVSPVPPPNGGIATWTLQYLEYFSKSKDYNVHIVNTAIQGKRITSNKRNLFDELQRYRNVKKQINYYLSKESIDIIHYNSSCTLFGLIKDYLILKKIKKEKIIYHCRCDLTNYVNNIFSIFLFKKISNYVFKIFVLNSQSKLFVKYHTNKDAICIPNYIDCNNFKSIYNFDFNDVRTFIYTGRISIEKGCDSIIRIAPFFPEWTFKLIGDPNCDIPLKKIPKNIEILGIMEHTQLLKELQKPAIFMFLSKTEGFSNSLVEAMACGLPIITTNVGANLDMIEDKGGIIINTDNIVESVNQIKEYVYDIHLLKGSSIFNIQKVNTTYDINAVMNQIIDEYTKVINERNKY